MMAKDTLLLTLNEGPFNEMLRFYKTVEIRKPSAWIESRLYNEDGSAREYEKIKFVNGYGSKRPYFVVPFTLFYQTKRKRYVYGNKYTAEYVIERNDYLIHFQSEILDLGNLNAKQVAYFRHFDSDVFERFIKGGDNG